MKSDIRNNKIKRIKINQIEKLNKKKIAVSQ